MKVGPIAIEVAAEDIAALGRRVGAIVSPDDRELAACSATAATLRRAARSDALEREAAELAGWPASRLRLKPGDVVRTSAGALAAEALLHAVVYGDDERLDPVAVRAAFGKALRIADEAALESVAIPAPALAPGSEEIAAAACGAILGFARSAPAAVRSVLVIAREPLDADHMRRLLAEAAAVAPVPAPAPAPARATHRAPAVPPPLADACRRGKLVIVVGSGLSLGKDVHGRFPLWTELPQRLLDACERYDVLSPEAIAAKRAVFQVRMSLSQMLSELGTLQAALGRDYQSALNDIFRPKDASPGAAHRAVTLTGAPAVLTTNYDQLLESVRETPPRQVYTWERAAQALVDLRQGRRVLFKIHGSAEDHGSVVMSALDYHRVREDRSYRAVLGYLLQESAFLFVGYGMNDPLDLDLALGGAAADFAASARKHYALMKDAGDGDRDRLSREYNVKVISYGEHDEVPVFLAALAAARSESGS